VAFDRTIAPWLGNRKLDGRHISLQRIGKLGQESEWRSGRSVDPSTERFGCSSSQHGSKLQSESA
jgi:hypothetical protein